MAKKLTQDKGIIAWSLLRIGLGSIFLWAFLDKLFGLGFATCRNVATNVTDVACSQAWATGGSPTTGFLNHAVKGPFSDIYHDLAGKGLVDWLFMLGLLVVGVGLILGVWTRLASVIGSLMLLLMWLAMLWPENNPVLDDHIIYILVLVGVYHTSGNQLWSLQSKWAKSQIVKSLPFLK
jgi:thiosulfate dehydrogenase [quinone] large subunit